MLSHKPAWGSLSRQSAISCAATSPSEASSGAGVRFVGPVSMKEEFLPSSVLYVQINVGQMVKLMELYQERQGKSRTPCVCRFGRGGEVEGVELSSGSFW